MKAQSEGALKGVLGYTEDKVVATDFRALWREWQDTGPVMIQAREELRVALTLDTATTT